jgi:hypothetical protein
MICTRMLKLRNNRLKLTKDIPLSQLVDSNLVKDIKWEQPATWLPSIRRNRYTLGGTSASCIHDSLADMQEGFRVGRELA